ncbi:acyl-CoA dehydrogenase [Hahella sp. KA22]|uniref:acyl-CoA dehydrogenase family protein n=1 Tax=Hahella sp. KA22 TaxID=1628392 RepID=UPI000FDEF6B3|nr:acyl-CoA dehydrogenase family protein [Hahella sp. KA22]AZZ92913.1 acyl-CoA dehydrogenase [Hahella sp. KA22]QAY56287.1 acyl-CoA dehydrogenase [Hahella sp. KA22]
MIMHDNAPTTSTSHSALTQRIRAFVNERVIPNEARLAKDDDAALALQSALTAEARAQGLWGLYYPAALGGEVATLSEYLPIAEQEGRSEFGPEIFGGRAALDARMLAMHGSDAIASRFLQPLAAGDAVSAYGMSEPDSIGSIPATINLQAQREGDGWRLDGRKWFISRARRADFITVVARTQADAPPQQALSMLVMPTDAPGFSILRDLDILGRRNGQHELLFDNVWIPQDHLLGELHGGMALMKQRLCLGRSINAAHWIGLAQRCLDLLGERVNSERGRLARLPDKQLIRRLAFLTHQGIVSARGQLQLAAAKLDAGLDGDMEVNMAKIAASHALNQAADSAIQVFGAEGLCDATPLSNIFRYARATRILDGADEVLINTVGRRILEGYGADAEQPAPQDALAERETMPS